MSRNPQEPDLRDELLQRKEKDQKIRDELFGGIQRGDLEMEGEEFEKLNKELEEIDKTNTNRMKEVIDEYGWPSQSLVGEDGEEAAWLLIQHADHDGAFQKSCIPLLEEAVDKGEADPSHLAHLVDRVRVHHEDECQLYGTQFMTTEDGGIEPFPICDEENLDNRRAEMGMQPFAEYKKEMREG